MRGCGTRLILGRLGVNRPVLGAAALTTLIAAAVAAALATFGGQVLAQAARHQLTVASGTTVALNGTVTAGQAGPATAAVRNAIRAGLGAIPFTLRSATWSDQLPWPAQPSPIAAGAVERAAPPGTAHKPADRHRVAHAEVPGIQAAVMPGVEAHAVLLAGRWPGSARRPDSPIPAALPAAVAAQRHVPVGAVLALRDVYSRKLVRIQVTGIFRPRFPASPYWRLNLIGPDGMSSVGRFTTYGPLIVNPGAFRHGLTVNAESWVVHPDLRHVTEAGLGPAATRLSARLQALEDPTSALGGLQVATGLPGIFRGVASDLVVARSLLAIGALQILLLAAAALAASARLLTSQREGELALFTARGGARWQVASISLAEIAPLAVGAAAAGLVAGSVLARLLSRNGLLRTAGLRVSGMTGAAWQAAALVAGLAVVIMLAPALRALSPILTRARRGRPAAISRAAHGGADVALIGLAALAVWQLRRYSAVAPSVSGGLGVDPVLVVAPAAALAGGTVAGVRLLPAAVRAGERLATRGRRLTTALAFWRLSRRPLRQVGPALLVVLGVATGTLALSQHQSWVRSSWDQAGFAAGAPVRLDAPEPVSLGLAGTIAAVARGRAGMPVANVTQGSGADAIALDARQAAGTVLLRRDLSALPEETLFARITPRRVPGLAVPGQPAQLVLKASLGPAALRLGRASVTASVQDGDGDTYVVAAGTLPADGRLHPLVIGLARRAVYPLRLLAITVAYPMPSHRTASDAVLTVAGNAGVPDRALAGWSAEASSPDLADLQESGNLAGPAGSPGSAAWPAPTGGGRVFSFRPGYGTEPGPGGAASITGVATLAAPGLRLPVIPGIATRAFLDSGHVTPGSTVPLAFGGAPVLVRIVATVAGFPAVTGHGGAVVVNLASLQDALLNQGEEPVPVTQWWLDMAHPPPGLPGGMSATTRAGLAAALLGNAVSATPQQVLLAIAVTGAVLALAGFGVSVAATISERRLESALLSALGVSRAAQVRQFCLEELLLSGPAAVAGLALGAMAALLLVPAVTLTPGATVPVPPAQTELAWAQAVPLALVVAALPVLAAALTLARRPDPAARLRAVEPG